MKILAIDDERLVLDQFIVLLKGVLQEAQVTGFINPMQALDWLAEQEADIVFLDIKMGKMNGIELAKKCKDLRPQVNIIFVTGYKQYSLDAMQLHASGYLMKPVRESELREELDNLRYPLPLLNNRRVRVQTFGNFEIFVDQKPLMIALAKCKECLAYLVDRKGARVTTEELAAVLWEDVPYDRRVQNNTYRTISRMMNTLRMAGVLDIVIKTRRDIAIDTEKVDCDYYRFLSGEVLYINAFHGEYMSNYSWAEFTLVELINTKKKR